MSKRKTTTKRLSGKAVTSVRERMGLNVGDFATSLGVSPASAYRWEATARPNLRPTVATLVLALDQLPEAELKRIGAAIGRACANNDALQAARVVLDAVATKAAA